MSFPDTVSGLLRTLLLSLSAIGSTYRTRESGGGSSGAEFYAELELKPWPATSTTMRKTVKGTTVATRRAEYRAYHEYRSPELSRPVALHGRNRGAKASPINCALSSDTDVSTNSQSSNRTKHSSKDTTIKSSWNAESHRGVVKNNQQASELCWRDYWV
ncbi:hypothetical protein F5B19DRAFT_492066 [Rostrohypoxylon terebratum]|nr:hypothetical protein F5B19DRAFT_492066 [Rostrohypoxylon terebratum]